MLYIMRNLFPELDCFIFSSERHTFVAAIEHGTDVVRYMGDFSLYSLRRREQLKERAADFMLTEARRNCVMLFNGYLPFIVHHGFMDVRTIGQPSAGLICFRAVGRQAVLRGLGLDEQTSAGDRPRAS